MHKILILIFIVGLFLCVACASAANDAFDGSPIADNDNVMYHISSIAKDGARAYDTAMTAFEPFANQSKNI